MKTILCLLSVLIFTTAASHAGSTSGPTEAAQAFYDAYMKVLLAQGDTEKFVLASKDITPAFRKAFVKLIHDGMDSDPIICGQDYPDEGFTASPAKIQGSKAHLTMKSRGDKLDHSFPITMRLVGGRWLISDTNDLKADAND